MHESKLKRPDFGDLHVVFLFRQNGVLEEGADLQKALEAFISDFTIVSQEIYNHAMAGYVLPLFQSLGVPSSNILHRVSKTDFQCQNASWCHLVNENCWIGSEKCPDCYVPPGDQEAPWYDDLYRIVRAMWDDRFIIIVQRSD